MEWPVAVRWAERARQRRVSFGRWRRAEDRQREAVHLSISFEGEISQRTGSDVYIHHILHTHKVGVWTTPPFFTTDHGSSRTLHCVVRERSWLHHVPDEPTYPLPPMSDGMHMRVIRLPMRSSLCNCQKEAGQFQLATCGSWRLSSFYASACGWPGHVIEVRNLINWEPNRGLSIDEERLDWGSPFASWGNEEHSRPQIFLGVLRATPQQADG